MRNTKNTCAERNEHGSDWCIRKGNDTFGEPFAGSIRSLEKMQTDENKLNKKHYFCSISTP